MSLDKVKETRNQTELAQRLYVVDSYLEAHDDWEAAELFMN